MPKVIFEKPDSFRVMDFLGALFTAQYPTYFMIQPAILGGDPARFGVTISEDLPNIPFIGLSSRKPAEKTFGFPTKTPQASDKDEVYDIEAMLLLEVGAGNLPAETEGETWVLQVMEQEKISLFQPIAVALAEEFGVNIIITPASMRDPDTKHQMERPANPDFPDAQPICPVIIRKTKPAE